MNRISGFILNLYFRFPGIRLFLLMIIVFIIFSIISTALMISEDVKTDPVGWEKKKYLSQRGITAKNIHVDRKGNLIGVVFEGVARENTGIYVSFSFDGGTSFINPVKIEEFKYVISNNPRIAISTKGQIYVSWHVLSEDESHSSIYYASSEDMGATWSDPKNISFGMQMEILPEPAFDNRDRLHLFFTSYSGGSFNLFHTMKREEKNFDEPEPVLNIKGNIRGAFFPAIKFVGNNVFVVCQGKEETYTDHLYFVRSDDYGRNWSRVDKITSGKYNNQAPAIEVYDDIIYLAFMNNSNRNWSINLMRGYNYGVRWDVTPLRISTTNANCFSPDITNAPDGELLITWHDLREKKSRIFYRKFSIKNKELLPEEKLSTRDGTGRNPICINTARKLSVLWEESGRIVINHTDNYVLPPAVYSSTHPEDKWSRDNAALIRWKRPSDQSGIAGYATLTDKNPYTNPSIQNQKSDTSSILITGLDDGVTYFHIRSIDGAGNMSRTVHYKLQVSSNPLAMPVVVSTTHPENETSTLSDAVFRWAVNDSRRLKGFLYSISKDTARKPAKFIQDFEIKFDDLESGVYFFNIAAVSKTNQVSRVATYSFIVGQGKLDFEYLKDLAKEDYGYREPKAKIIALPGLDITFPFGKAGKYNKGDFTVLLRPLHIAPEKVSGYSVVIGNAKTVPHDKINLKSGILNIAGLTDGGYTLGVKCRYFKTVNGRKKYYWTRPVYKSFTIAIDKGIFPFEKIYAMIMERFRSNPFTFMAVILLFSVTVVYRGFGRRIGFYLKMINYRLKYYFS